MSVDPAFLDRVRARVGVGDALEVAVEAAARSSGVVLGSSALSATSRTVRGELFGAGPLQALLDDPDVTDVLVNGPRDVWVERAGRLVPAALDLGSESDVRALAVRLAAAGQQRLDDASPTVDARLPDGTRLHAVLPPVAGTGVLLSLRVVRSRALTVDELVTSGTLAVTLVPMVRALVATRANVLISGATGSGKTTLLAALLSLVPHDERIVVIEEAGELRPNHPHVVRLLARRPNVDGAGSVGLSELVRTALRMRPDRIVLGECRGAEVRDVLTALNTGHDGGCATVHANAAEDVPARLEALAALAGMSRDAVAAQASSAIDAVLHLRRSGPDRAVRYVAEVGVVRRSGGGTLEVVDAVRADAGGTCVSGPGWPALAERLGLGGSHG
ncbi:TadA family conjugal transfer-associated ATPase [Cellulomonas sp. URHD0024]|uniref:TadA family conjugal transfer-associated ATPase n=1 Tax=Cellulomonas sp. URHD0024 TaxID=1302620 RepID=UPI0004076AD0|nr:TadA family conjugal transfer-associated ATPase [Cellulomonas sp. URHD0024]